MERLRSSAIDEEEKDTLPQNVPALHGSIMGNQSITRAPLKQPKSHVTVGMIDNWEDQIDEKV